MTKPIPDKAEIALEYPDKLYVGTFERSSRFEAHLDPTGIALILERPGADDIRKSIHMHINFGLFADILRELASTVGRIPRTMSCITINSRKRSPSCTGRWLGAQRNNDRNRRICGRRDVFRLMDVNVWPSVDAYFCMNAGRENRCPVPEGYALYVRVRL